MGLLKILKNVDITKNYKNTFTFSNESAQETFFLNKAIWSKDLNVQRIKSPCRVSINAETLRGANYIMFQNDLKWYYAFIDEIEYISKDVSLIHFTIDVMQTWKWDVEYKHSYIEREHVSDDTIGKHILNENLNVGEYVNNSDMLDNVTDLENISILVASTVVRDGGGGFDDVVGEVYAGVYSGVAYLYFPNTSSGITALNGFLEDITSAAKADAIISIFMIPHVLLPSGITTGDPIPSSAAWGSIKTVYKNHTVLDGYTPKNNKLFVYPYNFLYVSNSQGAAATFNYENFADGTLECDFQIGGDIGPNATVVLTPKDYKNTTTNYDESFKLNGYPLCSWTTDIFKEWLAQNIVSAPLSIASSALSLGVGAATGNPIAIGSGILGVASSIGSFYEKSIQPNHTKGSVSGNANVALGIQNFYFFNKVIKSERARVIDDFFTRFGYKVNELKIPNFETRPYFNYIKCLEVNIFGDIPQNDLQKIKQIFKDGITFWHGDYVGNYSLNNSI